MSKDTSSSKLYTQDKSKTCSISKIQETYLKPNGRTSLRNRWRKSRNGSLSSSPLVKRPSHGKSLRRESRLSERSTDSSHFHHRSGKRSRKDSTWLMPTTTVRSILPSSRPLWERSWSDHPRKYSNICCSSHCMHIKFKS